LVEGLHPHKWPVCHDDLLAGFKVAQLNLGRFALGTQFADQAVIDLGRGLTKGDQSADTDG